MEMINAFVSGLDQCFTWSTFSLMMIGIAIGFVVGILPGLGGPTAMALMLPFIFKMFAVEAFAFLVGNDCGDSDYGRYHLCIVRSTRRANNRIHYRRWPCHGAERRGRQGGWAPS